MAVLKSLGRVLVAFDKDAINFIEACNADSSGLKLTSTERLAINFLVKGLKNFKDGDIRLWDLIDVFYPAIGNTKYKVSLNLKSPDKYRLTSIANSLFAPMSTPLGLKGMWDTQLIHDTSFLNNISVGAYLVDSSQNWGGAATIISNQWPGSTHPNSVSINFRNSLDTLGSSPAPYTEKPYKGMTASSKATGSTVTAVVNNRIRYSVSNNPVNTVAYNKSFYLNNIAPLLEQSDIEMNCIFIGKYLSANALEYLSKITEHTNMQLARSSFQGI